MIFDFFNVGIFIIFSFGLCVLLLFICFFITFQSKLDMEKSSVYECGFSPFSESRYKFQVQFYLIAILFLLFDIEILYLYPYTLSFLSLSSNSIVGLIVIFVILFLGLLYEISRGILKFYDRYPQADIKPF